MQISRQQHSSMYRVCNSIWLAEMWIFSGDSHGRKNIPVSIELSRGNDNKTHIRWPQNSSVQFYVSLVFFSGTFDANAQLRHLSEIINNIQFAKWKSCGVIFPFSTPATISFACDVVVCVVFIKFTPKR